MLAIRGSSTRTRHPSVGTRSVHRRAIRRRPVWLALFLSCIFAVAGNSRVYAYSSAFVALYDDGAGVYERTAALQEVLVNDYGIEDVSIEINASPAEIPYLVRRYLAAPARLGDRRFVWVSGEGRHDHDALCPNRAAKNFTVLAATIIIAPDCYLRMIRIDNMTHHLETAPIWVTLKTLPPPVLVPLSRGTVAFLSLPSRQGRHVTTVDRLLLRTMLSLRGRPISPGYLLQVLRNGFVKDGSGFTPRLAVAPAMAAWATNLIGGDFRSVSPGRHLKIIDLTAGLPSTIRATRTPLFRAPDLNSRTVTILSSGLPVRIMRRDFTGRMAFVRTANDNFGWVKVGALHKR